MTTGEQRQEIGKESLRSLAGLRGQSPAGSKLRPRGDSLYEETSEPAHQVPDRVREMVAAGRLGRKTGGGFYDYS